MQTIFPGQVSELLEKFPPSWLGTTFPNDARFAGRHGFMERMFVLLSTRTEIVAEQLDNLFPEDYVRLGSPLSCVLEVVRAVEKGFQPRNVFSFGSSTMPLLAVLLSNTTDHVFIYGVPPSARRDKHEEMIRHFFDCKFTYCQGSPKAHQRGTVVLVSDTAKNGVPDVDAVVAPLEGFLYVDNCMAVPTEDRKDAKGDITVPSMVTLRKRLGGTAPTPDVLCMLKGKPRETEPDTIALKQHLKQMAGLPTAKGDVLLGLTGLAALSTCVMAAVAVSGGRPVFQALSSKLEAMKSGPRKPLTLIQLEYGLTFPAPYALPCIVLPRYPTNPDMKDCPLEGLEEVVLSYQRATGTKVVLMFDTTFSPISQVARKAFEHIAVIVFNSLSKSVSGGKTTGGSLVANHDPTAQKLLSTAHEYLDLMGTEMKPCQKRILVSMHAETEQRVANAHKNAADCAAHLEAAVFKASGKPMQVNFVSAEQIARGVTPATFSFNLPPPVGVVGQQLDAVAQTFVDWLVSRHKKGIKPCVSFGQKNELVYVTVPATSTQGAISAEAKAKQAVGGVQLVRFSFPPTMDRRAWRTAVEGALAVMYSRDKQSRL